MKNCLAYIRVSTESQARYGVSLEAQQERVEKWAVANGYQVSECFCDSGISGKRADNRQALQDCLKRACKEKVPVVTYSLSRISRSVRDMIGIADKLQKAGAALVSLSENLDLSTASGKLSFQLFSVLAEHERNLISERTTSSMQHLKAQGKRVSGKMPYGWDLAGDSLKANKAETKVLGVMMALRSEGKSYEAIAKHLTESRIKPKYGKAWFPGTVYRIIKAQEVPQAA
jgi:site-specific DNA recombinase